MAERNDPICDFVGEAQPGLMMPSAFGVKNRVVLRALLPHIGGTRR